LLRRSHKAKIAPIGSARVRARGTAAAPRLVAAAAAAPAATAAALVSVV
jgi:hypothetical protein